MNNLVAVQFKCPSCEKTFVGEDSFATPYYHCDNCSEYWPKEDGRNCPQCHKFGRNAEMPICEDCTQEVEEYIAEVNPDEVDVINDNGDEIVSEKKAMARKTNQEKFAEARAREKEIRDVQIAILKAECERRGIPKQDFDEYIAGSKTLTVMGQSVVFTAQAGVQFSMYDDAIPPFTLEFRLRVNVPSGGWSGHIAETEKFTDIQAMFDRAAEVMADPFQIAQEQKLSDE